MLLFGALSIERLLLLDYCVEFRPCCWRESRSPQNDLIRLFRLPATYRRKLAESGGRASMGIAKSASVDHLLSAEGADVQVVLRVLRVEEARL